MMTHAELHSPEMPAEPLSVGLLGCGSIARTAHLPAYRKFGIPVVGAFDISDEALSAASDEFGVRAFGSTDALLADPAVQVVDVAVRTEDRYPVIRRALEAGKHVLSQKPFANDTAEAEDILRLAEERDLVIAVNQNGRWAPAWRAATVWATTGEIGAVMSIDHAFTASFDWTIATHFNDMTHFVLYDYAAHWFDICRCWLAGKHITSVRAWDGRAPRQPAESATPWNMTAHIACADGTTATITGTGAAAPDVRLEHRFGLVGERGVIRGEVLDREWAELITPTETLRVTPTGSWFPDGFAGAMGELQRAVRDGRQPYNSGRHVLDSLALSLAAVDSAERDGAAVAVDIQA